jgi:hypothetical protein
MFGYKIGSGYGHYPFIIPISFKQFRAKREKVVRWITVILQYYALWLIFKKPGNGARYTTSAPKILIPEKCFDFAFPVHS